MVTLIDTHSHIDLKDFEDDIDSVVENAKLVGVEKVIVPSVDRSSFESVIKLCDKYENVYGALGLHPEEMLKIQVGDIELMKNLSQHKKVIAIGECGLDYYWDKTYIQEQKELFKKQIGIAQELNLPLLVHDRDAHQDTFELLKDVTSIPVVLHCFSGSLEFANECLKKGFYLAFGGVVTFKNAKKAKEVVKNIPLDRLLLETDAPYMTPEPNRGKRNEPKYVKFVAEEIARLRDCSYEEIANATTENAKRIFKF